MESKGIWLESRRRYWTTLDFFANNIHFDVVISEMSKLRKTWNSLRLLSSLTANLWTSDFRVLTSHFRVLTADCYEKQLVPEHKGTLKDLKHWQRSVLQDDHNYRSLTDYSRSLQRFSRSMGYLLFFFWTNLKILGTIDKQQPRFGVRTLGSNKTLGEGSLLRDACEQS